MTCRYKYSRLAHQHSIRVVTLMPGLLGTRILLALDEEPLKNAQYEALSYTWGKKERNNKVFCEDKHIFVTDNLLAALEHIRYIDKSRQLWIDQLSIDQGSKNEPSLEEDGAAHDQADEAVNSAARLEKGAQVNIMSDIYAAAAGVVVWLGDTSTGSTIAMENLQTLVKHGKQTPQAVLDSLQYRKIGALQIGDLLSRSWFNRIWTVQEALQARKCVVQCGRDQMPFEVLTAFNNYYQNNTDAFWSDLVSSFATARQADPSMIKRFITEHIQTIEQLRCHLPNRDRRSPFPHLHRLRSCGSYRDKDRIYAVLQILPRSTTTAIGVPRYDKSFGHVELYTRVSRSECEQGRLAESLGAAGRFQQRSDFSGPSWVADWAPVKSSDDDDGVPLKLNHPFWFLDYETQEKLHHPLFRASGALLPVAQIGSTEAHLRVRGKLIDRIKELARPFSLKEIYPKRSENDSAMERLTALLTSCKAISAQVTECENVARKEISEPEWPLIRLKVRRTLLCDLQLRGDGSNLGGVYERLLDEDIMTSGFDGVSLGDKELTPIYSVLTQMMQRLEPINKVIQLICDVWKARAFFVTDDERLGLGPGTMLGSQPEDVVRKHVARPGDRVCVIRGCHTPFIVRRLSESTDAWTLIGECYVSGLMDGEAYGEAFADVAEQEIELC